MTKTTQIPYNALVEGSIRPDQQVIRELESLLDKTLVINDGKFTIICKKGLLNKTFEIYRADGYSVRMKTGFGLIFGLRHYVPEGGEEE